MGRDWALYERELKARKRHLVEFLLRQPTKGQLEAELAGMNKRKNGHPFQLPESIIQFSMFLKSVFPVDDRTLIIFISRLLDRWIRTGKEFCHSALVKRRDKVDLDFPSRITPENLKGKRLYFDGVCYRLGRGGYYRSKQYNTPVKYLRIGVFTDEAGHALDFCIGDEHDAEINMIREKMPLIVKSCAEALVIDGAGMARDVVVDSTKAGIRPVIRASDPVKAAYKNKPPPTRLAKPKKEEEIIWEKYIQEQQDHDKWKKESGYTMRWPYSEGYFSALKRGYGETVVSRCPKGIHDELCVKFLLKEGATPLLWG
jgi:hypothetical protein